MNLSFLAKQEDINCYFWRVGNEALANGEYEKAIEFFILAKEAMPQLATLLNSSIKLAKHKQRYALSSKVSTQDDTHKGKKILFVSHEMTYTGAPISLLDIAQSCLEMGFSASVTTKKEGNFSIEWEKCGITYYPTHSTEEITKLALYHDICFINTITLAKEYQAIKKFMPTIWFLREPIKNYLNQVQHLNSATNAYTMSPLSQKEYHEYNPTIGLFKHGIKDYYKSAPTSFEPIRFAVIGTVCSRKGQDIFIDAITKIPRDKLSNVEFIILGKKHDESFYNNLQSKATSHVTFLSEVQTKDELSAFYEKISCVVIPSRQEPTSRVAIESMMMGRPVIFSDAVGAKYLLEEEKNGFLFQSENSQDLADKLLKIIEKPSLLTKMSSEARETYLKNNSMGVFQKRLLDIINSASKTLPCMKSKNKLKLLVHLHLYYHDQLDYFLDKLKNITEYYDLFITVIEENTTSSEKILSFKSDAHIVHVKNIGYDVYPFLQVLQSVNLETYEYVLKIHTKNYRHSTWEYNKLHYTGYQWRDDLVEPLIGSQVIFSRNMNLLHYANKNISMLGSKNLLRNIENILQVNTTKEACKKLNIKYSENSTFICGTMFLAKTDIFTPLCSQKLSASDFIGENRTGDLGTLAHSLETIFGMLALSNSNQIVGVHSLSTLKRRYEEIILPTENELSLKNKKILDSYPDTMKINRNEVLRNIDSFTQVGVENIRTTKLIVSLTSYPARIEEVAFTVFSLLNQTIKPDAVILFLGEDKFPLKEKELPKILLDLCKHGLTINWCEDIRSYTKLIPALKLFPNDIIITADDDIYYPENWLELLYNEYITNPGYIHCHRAHKIKFDSANKIKKYSDWDKSISEESLSYKNFLTGVGGVLYPPKSLHNDVFDIEKFKQLAPYADDIWFWTMAVLNNTKIHVIKNSINTLIYTDLERELGLNNETTLLSYNVHSGGNDKQLDAVFMEYPQVLSRTLED